jgi:hypothetical protein
MTQLQTEVDTGYNTLKKYVEFIQYIQNQPRLKIIAESKRAKFITIETMPLKQDLEYARELFPEVSTEQKILIKLNGLKNIPVSSLSENEQKLLKSLKEKKRVTIKNNKINLTKLGITIAKGAERVYGTVG